MAFMGPAGIVFGWRAVAFITVLDDFSGGMVKPLGICMQKISVPHLLLT